jgi:hypothetical protein
MIVYRLDAGELLSGLDIAYSAAVYTEPCGDIMLPIPSLQHTFDDRSVMIR